MSSNNTITDKTILVTGANRGIGKAIVEGFLENGAAKVYAAVRTLSNADALVKKYGGKVIPIKIDLSDPQTITDAAALAKDVDVVINNAGVLKASNPLGEEAIGNLDFEVSVNVVGLIRMAQAFAPILKANGGGVLAQLNSVASLRNFSGFSTYSASKAASYSITQGLNDVLKEQGTQVISIHPGPIATDMASDAGLDEIAEPPSLVSDAIIDAIQTGKFHAFPGAMATQIGSAYESFAVNVVEANMAEG